ncbi:MAG: hypothetical protein DRJ52_07885 [Thermoprotei archaeon]|nr:MAG: hypothetical protein DRJ52_07885 [Thermoprotei archaeon]RLE99723.1 MAG: hypothetical protein DRJ63_04495 [Thermoprotei archaeon]HDI75507.1 hypothetical protein [Thermoprotei archaeon]
MPRLEVKDIVYLFLSLIAATLISWAAYYLGGRETGEVIFIVSLVVYIVVAVFKVFEKVEIPESSVPYVPQSNLFLLRRNVEKSLQTGTIAPIQPTLRRIILERLSIKSGIDPETLSDRDLEEIFEDHQLLASIVRGDEIRFKSLKGLEDLLAEVERWFD